MKTKIMGYKLEKTQRIMIVVLVLGCFILLQIGYGQDNQENEIKEWKYDWEAQKHISRPNLNSGEAIRIKIIKPNTVCYDYEINGKQISTMDSESIEVWKKALDALSLGSKSSISDGLISTIAQYLPVNIRKITIQKFSDDYNALVRDHDSLNVSLNTFIEKICKPDTSHGRPSVSDEIKTESLVKDIKENKLKIIQTVKNVCVKANGACNKLPITPDSLEKNYKSLAKLLELVGNEIKRLFISKEIFVEENTSRIEVTVQAKSTALHPIPNFTLVDPFVINVRQRHRVFVSVGWLASTLKDRDYQDVIIPDPDNGENTIRTIADKSSNSILTFSPIIVLNVSIHEGKKGGNWLFSSGIATKTVDGSQGVDFLVGVSYGFSDRFFITGGAYIGRQQALLIDIDKSKSLPTSVTRSQIVGIKRTVEPALTFSVKI